jgi:hypothetical protein
MMAVVLASKTLAAFESAVARDQGAAFRVWLGKVIPHIGDAYRGEDEGFRSHMGASIIGGECGRAIWYSFRWATRPRFTGQMLRLFNRGHLEEARFIALLLTIGVQVYQQDADGKQFRISSYGGHFGGSGDGVGVGIPDLPPGTAALTEFKTHNDASFKVLKKDGVRDAKLEHFVQMQTYMRKMGLRFALYLAVNKNTDEIYGEIVTLDETVADQFIQRAHKIIPLQVAPDKISKSPGWRACARCDHRPVCHLGIPPERNCRTCKHSVPHEDGKWWCENNDRRMTMIFGPKDGVSIAGETFELGKARQLAGCAHYEKNESM